MIEILVAIGIILILLGMLLGALKYVKNSAARSTTTTRLQALKGMLAEMDAANHFQNAPAQWLWSDHITGGDIPDTGPGGAYTVVSSTGSVSLDFWNYPWVVPAFSAGGVNLPYPSGDALDAPGDVSGSDVGTQQAAQRNASFAILNTQVAMQVLASLPANKAALQALPGEAVMMPQWQASPVALGPASRYSLGTGAPGLLGVLNEDGSDTAEYNVKYPFYAVGTHVAYNGAFYVCVQNTPTFKAAPPDVPPTNNPFWQNESVNALSGQAQTPRGAPLLLDGWGNPIIFVPATGLHVKLTNGRGSYQPASASQQYIIISPEGHVANNGTASAYVDKLGRPFFASAGPDGDFTKGDDNLYSFEQ